MSQLASNRIQPFEQRAHPSERESIAKWLLSLPGQLDLLVVLCFCAIGLVVTFAALAEFIDFSDLMEMSGLY